MFGSRLSCQFSCPCGAGSIIRVCGWHILFHSSLSVLFLNFTWMNLPLLFRLLFELMRMKTLKRGLSNWVSRMKFQCFLSLIRRILCKSIPSHYSHLALILLFSHSISLNLENWRLHRRWTHISITDISCWFSYVTYPLFHSNRCRLPSLHSGIPMLCTEENVTIVVSTVDKAPICYPDLFHLQEHIPIGSVISTYQAISRPHEQIVYTMPNNSFITIHPLTGVLQTVRDIDYETTLNQQ